MNSRWSATAKGIALLAVAAATPAWDVTALCLFFLIRHQIRVWDPTSYTVRHPTSRHRRTVRQWVHHWRLELSVAFGLTAARWPLTRIFGFGPADLAMTAAVASALWSPANGWARAQLVGLRRRLLWERSLAAVSPVDTVPAVLDLRSTPTGETVQVRTAPGSTVAQLAERAEALAAWHGVAEVRVRRDANHAGIAHITSLRTDPLGRMSLRWPPPLGPVSLWNPVPVGVDEDGGWVTVTLFEHNLLVGGEPGAGKSVAVHQLVAAAALDPTARLWLLDPKLVELAAWRDIAERFAGNDIFDATDTLRAVQQAMDDRYTELLDGRQRKVSVGTPLHLVVVDELAHYLTWPDKKARDAFGDVLRDLVSRGRAAGVVVIAATQKPASEVIPTSLRDLFGWRWALRCTTPAASDTILGAGWASQGVSAATINPTNRGVGYLLHESGEPTRLRAFHLDDATIAAAAAHAHQLRRGTGQGDA